MAPLGTLTVKIGTDLTELNRGLGVAGQGVQKLGNQVSGIGSSLTKNLTAPIRESTTALSGHAAEVGKSVHGIGNLSRELVTLTRNVLGLNPVVAQAGGLLGNMAIGAGPMVAVLAGVAALAYGYEKLTAGARDTAKATDEAIKSLEALKDKQALGSLSGTSAREAERAGVALFNVQEKLTELRGKYATQSAVGGGSETKKEIVKQEAEEARLRGLIKAHENEVTDVRAEKAKKQASDQKSALDQEWKDWQDFIAKKVASMKAVEDLNDKALRERREFLERSKEMGELGIGFAGTARAQAPLNPYRLPGLKPDAITATYNSIGNELSRNQQALRDGLKEIADSIGVTLAGKLLMAFGAGGGSGSSFGSQVGGSLGGKLGAGAIGSLTGKLGQAAFPIIGGLVGSLAGGLFGSLFDHKKSVDSNTEALNKLTESITNGPTGFKTSGYRFAATDGMPVINIGQVITLGGADFMRYLRQTSNDFGARGGYALASG